MLDGRTTLDTSFNVLMTSDHLQEQSDPPENRPNKVQKSSAGESNWKPLCVRYNCADLLDQEQTWLREQFERPKTNRSGRPHIHQRSAGPWFRDFEWSEYIPSKLTREIIARADTKQYTDGDVILDYGEHKRTVVVLLKIGQVDVLSPLLCKNPPVQHASFSKKNTVFNSHGFFGDWSGQYLMAIPSATCCHSTPGQRRLGKNCSEPVGMK